MVTGIIAEYNIFHNGHKYQIDEVKRHSDAVIAVMSGSFVQRGDVAITDKWSRAKMALMNGVDLVIELPTCYALNAAPNFAQGGIGILNALGIVDSVAFGSECGDTDKLIKAAKVLEYESSDTSDLVKKYMSDGMSYPSALSKAHSGIIDSGLISSPNNILAIEYIRALIRTNSSITPITIKRHLSGHHDTSVTENFTSASTIREMLKNGENIENLIPYNIAETDAAIPFSLSYIDSAFIAKLRTSSTEYLKNINEVAEGLENRLIRSAMECDNFISLAEQTKNKRYTMSKIRRIIISSLIGFTKDIYAPSPEYVRVLGMNKTGSELLKRAKKNCSIPIITKTADFKENSPQFRLDLRATDIAMLCSPDSLQRKGGTDFKRSPIVL